MYHQRVQPQIHALESELQALLRTEEAERRGVPTEALPLEFVPLPSPPSGAELWDCLRRPYNQHDVLYTHMQRPPVRVDPVRHRDPFAERMAARHAAQARAAVAKEKEREAR